MPKGQAVKPVSTEPVIAQQRLLSLHIWLKDISPMIWRRVLIHDDSSLADLHYVIQIIFNWDDYHLNRFYIRGRNLGISHEGGIWVENAHDFKLSDFSFRTNEKFFYEYDLHVPWRHNIRVERVVPCDGKAYPHCISGQGLAPPEECGGYLGFFALQEENCLSNVLSRGIEMLERLSDHDELPSREDALYLQRWLKPRKINRRRINHRLKLYTSKDPAWMEESEYGNSDSDSDSDSDDD
jgi:hypothetical protein